jgi:hypothetical protein
MHRKRIRYAPIPHRWVYSTEIVLVTAVVPFPWKLLGIKVADLLLSVIVSIAFFPRLVVNIISCLANKPWAKLRAELAKDSRALLICLPPL